MQNKFHIPHIYNSVYMIEFCLKLRVRSQGMMKFDRNEISYISMKCRNTYVFE
jgi:hypothetical protein